MRTRSLTGSALGLHDGVEGFHIGDLIMRIGFSGILYHKYNKEPPKSIGNYLGPYIRVHRFRVIGHLLFPTRCPDRSRT